MASFDTLTSDNGSKSTAKTFRYSTSTGIVTASAYVDIISVNTKDVDRCTFSPVVTDSDDADFRLQVAVEQFDNDISDIDSLTWHVYDEITGVASSDIPTNNTFSLLPTLEGITAAKIQVKSNLTTTPSAADIFFRETM